MVVCYSFFLLNSKLFLFYKVALRIRFLTFLRINGFSCHVDGQVCISSG